MKIGIDARMLGLGFGLARYTQQLVEHLLDIDQENEYVLFLNKESDTSHLEGRGTLTKRVIVDIPWYSWKEQTQFKRIIQKEGIELMHFLHWNIPLFYYDPFVVTVHDLTMFHYPRPSATTLGPFKFWVKDKAHRLVVKSAVRAAKHIIVTSAFTKQDIHETLGVPLNKMTVTYQAPFVTSDSGNVSVKSVDVLKKYRVTKPYILYVGAAYPHKNVERLIEAWKLFEDKHSGAFNIVLVGKRDYFYSRLLESTAAKQCNGLIHTGLVSDDELSALYMNAALYIIPSLYEGFGLPPLEAMARGVPVVSSNRSCLPEVLGEAALYFDPENLEYMVEMIERGLTDEYIRYDLKQNANKELARYSWKKLAFETKKIYEIFGSAG